MSIVQRYLNFSPTPEEVASHVEVCINGCLRINDDLAKIDTSEVTVENFFEPYLKNNNYYLDEISVLEFLQHVSPDPGVRSASRQAQEKWSKFAVSQAMRADIYNRMIAVNQQMLSGDQLRAMKHILVEYKRLGVHLPESVQQELQTLQNRMDELSIAYEKNIADYNKCLYFTTVELDGVDESFLLRTKIPDTYLHRVSHLASDVMPILEFCNVRNTRKEVFTLFDSVAFDDNIKILQELLLLRDKHARLLGYKNQVEYQTEVLMSKDGQTVNEFLTQVLTNLSPITVNYITQLRDMTPDGELHDHDYLYYHQKNLQTNYHVDHQKIQEHFPTDYVWNQMLEIYAELFGLQFKELELPHEAWHKDLRYFEVRDAETSATLGSFYIDLFPREGKYSHAAVWSIVYGRAGSRNSQVLPMDALICNFTPNTVDHPSVLDFRQVTTLFHEFGHVIHGILGGYRQKYLRFSGTNVECDFVETPSQMIENWMYEPRVLKRISSPPLSDEMIQKLIESRKVGAARAWTRQATLALIDQKIHERGDWVNAEELISLYCEISHKYMGYHCGTGKSLGNWNHLAGGYDAQYYGYVWSRVISVDLYSKFTDSGDALNKEVGMAYRKTILEPGGSVDASEMVRNFMGRKISLEPFLHTLF